ncbi:MAG: hemerythrin domain-containing protein [Candidatus Baltobacteraceae bacterium]
MADAISLLKEQHAEVLALLMKVVRSADPVLRANVFRTIDTNVRIHSKIEEEFFYPAFRERAANGSQAAEVENNYQDHAAVARTLAQIERSDPADPFFLQSIGQLKAQLAEHIHDEEHRFFKEAARLFTPQELLTLGYRMENAARAFSPVYQMSGPRM